MRVRERTVELTERFYEWERCGRGWDVFDYPVELEPPLHFPDWYAALTPVRQDDTHRTSWLRSLFEPRQAPLQALPEPQPLPDPDMFTWGGPISEKTLLVPENENIPSEALRAWLDTLSTTAKPVSFEFIAQKGRVELGLCCAREDERLVENTLRATAPAITLRDTPHSLEQRLNTLQGEAVVAVEFGLGCEFMLPLVSSSHKGVDPVAPLILGLAEAHGESLAVLQVLFAPTASPWAEAIRDAVFTPSGHPFFADAPDFSKHALEKIAAPLFAVSLRLGIVASTYEQAYSIMRAVGAALGRFSSPYGNQLIPLGSEEPADVLADMTRRQSRRTGMILSADELSNLVCLPEAQTAQNVLLRRSAGQPLTAPEQDGIVLGEYLWSGETKQATLSTEDRLSHVHVIGASGTGKSTLLVQMILQDIEAGRGVAVVDPHGDLVDEVLRRVPASRADEVVVFDPSDPDWIVGWNILSADTEAERQMLASDLVGVFKRLATSWGDQMTSVLANAILSFLDTPTGGTLADLRRFLVDGDYRRRFVQGIRDPHLASYWQIEFPRLIGRKPQTPILTRLDTLLRNRLVRDVVSMRERHLDFRAHIEQGHILLARLSQGAVGRENAALLGSLLISKLHQVALTRQDTRQSQRSSYFVYIDEFHELATASMATLFSGVRKYGIGLTVAHQDLYQLRGMESTLEHAVMTNTHTRLCFRTGDEDARRLAAGFRSFDADALRQLTRGEVIGRSGSAFRDFKLRTTTLPRLDEEEAEGNRSRILMSSRQKWGMSRPALRSVRVEPLPEPIPSAAARETPTPVTPLPEAPYIAIPAKRSPVPPAPDAAPIPPPAPVKREPVPDGRGGPEHQYLQNLVREWAHERGYKVMLEHQLASRGRVDAVLEREGMSVACEVSVTTNVDHEIGNIQKCLDAGYALVLSISLKRRFQQALGKRLNDLLSDKQRKKVRILTPEEFLAWLEQQPRSEHRIAGYTVRTRVRSEQLTEQQRKKQAISDVIGRSLRRLKNRDV